MNETKAAQLRMTEAEQTAKLLQERVVDLEKRLQVCPSDTHTALSLVVIM